MTTTTSTVTAAISYAAEPRAIRVAVITVSDRAYQGIYKDESGPKVAAAFPADVYEVAIQRIVPDEANAISNEIVRCAEIERVDVILTTGGAGCSPRDVTPEATFKILQREVVGLSDAIRLSYRETHPTLMLSRGVSGIRNQSLVVNLPGSPENAKLALEIILPALPHFVKTVRQQRRPPRKTSTNSPGGDSGFPKQTKPRGYNR
ncbi:MAG: MogA/MoaB family molybdenum cofactor biosynthesis protein [Chloroherpetonaceae bacterium]|nr:MogA/MoaB family molybdenum cofactor biosynthesis protein [Chloroherpetonaceae bacterium]